MQLKGLKEELAKYGQEHLLQHWNNLSQQQQNQLQQEIEELDMEEVTEYFKRATGDLDQSGQKLDDRTCR